MKKVWSFWKMWIPRTQNFILFFLKATFYVPRQPKTNLEGAKQPRGKLYDKYTCIIKDLRASGLRSKESEQPTTVHDDGVKRDEQGEVKEDLEWLRRCLEPEVEATERWSRTSDYRLHSLRVTPTRKKAICLKTTKTDTGMGLGLGSGMGMGEATTAATVTARSAWTAHKAHADIKTVVANLRSRKYLIYFTPH
ncbi:uncharacterized protein LOC121467567 [Drosophila elegans]|uniref:uncharacterized protein LOC121467567 n=1 Tax=Drosophila elegans TaxID=30023 RepID=UPI001BC86568|nr:uncharacterized protein LOC121467567 [Drosophila elegans]